MMTIIHWLDRNIEKAVLIVVSLFMLTALTLQVLSRYVFNASISWGEELSIFGMVWLAYFGAANATLRRRHIRITVFADLLSPKHRKILDMCVNAVFMFLMCFLVYGTVKVTYDAYRLHQVAAASGLPRWIALAGMPLAFALVCVRLVQDTAKLVREYKIIAAGGTVAKAAPSIKIKMEE